MNVQFHFDELLDEIDGLVDSQCRRVDAEVVSGGRSPRFIAVVSREIERASCRERV